MNNQRDTFAELRKKFDGSDPFMSGGHQIIKIRKMDRKTPDWAKNKVFIQKMLLRSFPMLRTNPRHRAGAARWAVIIQLYFLMQMTQGQVAEQTKLSLCVVKSLIRSIHRASKGRRADGTRP